MIALWVFTWAMAGQPSIGGFWLVALVIAAIVEAKS